MGGYWKLNTISLGVSNICLEGCTFLDFISFIYKYLPQLQWIALDKNSLNDSVALTMPKKQIVTL